MDFFYNLFQSFVPGLVGTVLFVLVSMAVAAFIVAVLTAFADRISNYFFGYEVADKVSEIGLKLAQLFVLPHFLVWQTLSWPWRFRDQRLFKETFNLAAPRNYKERAELQEKVDDKLAALAEYYHNSCNRQTNLRYLGGSTTEKTNAANCVEFDKRQFWDAHAMAKKFHFYVHKTHGEYL